MEELRNENEVMETTETYEGSEETGLASYSDDGYEPLSSYDGQTSCGGDVLKVIGLATLVAVPVAGAIWMWKRHKAKKALAEQQKQEENVCDADYKEVTEDTEEEPEAQEEKNPEPETKTDKNQKKK